MKATQEFIFQDSSKEHIIMLEKKKFPWWIFLFLLLLLLFIKVDKTLQFQVIDAETKQAIESAEVAIQLNNESQNVELQQISDNNGKLELLVDRQPIYKLIFLYFTDKRPVAINAAHPEYRSYQHNEAMKELAGRQNIIPLSVLKGFTVTVIDSITRNPIPNIEVELNHLNFSKKQATNADGQTLFGLNVLEIDEKLRINVRHDKYENTLKILKINSQNQETRNIEVAILSLDEGGMRGERGEINVNLKWEGHDDLDLIIIDPCKDTVYFKKKTISCDGFIGQLDIDANYHKDSLINNPQENIFWDKASKGEYQIIVMCYDKRERKETPFIITVFKDGEKKTIEGIAKRKQEIIPVHKVTFD